MIKLLYPWLDSYVEFRWNISVRSCWVNVTSFFSLNRFYHFFLVHKFTNCNFDNIILFCFQNWRNIFKLRWNWKIHFFFIWLSFGTVMVYDTVTIELCCAPYFAHLFNYVSMTLWLKCSLEAYIVSIIWHTVSLLAIKKALRWLLIKLNNVHAHVRAISLEMVITAFTLDLSDHILSLLTGVLYL